MHSAQELWHNKEDSWIKDVKWKGNTASNSVLIESICSFISVGTEKTLLSDPLTEEIASAMKVPYMKGDLNHTFTYGYSIVGSILSEREDLNGKLAHVMHPHQNFFEVDIKSLFFIPEDMNPKLAVLASNMETALTSLWDAQVEIGDRVIVMGYGSVGGLIASLINQMVGVDLYILERDEERKSLAHLHGFKTLDESLSKFDEYFDIAFNTTSNKDALQNAFKLTRTEGKIVELSWFGTQPTSLHLGSHFHYGRKQLISSQVSQIPYRKQPMWDYRSRKELVFKLLQNLNPMHLIDHEVKFSETPSFFNSLRRGEGKRNIGTIINY